MESIKIEVENQFDLPIHVLKILQNGQSNGFAEGVLNLYAQ